MKKGFKDEENNFRIGKKVEPPRITSIFLSYVEIPLWQTVYRINAPQGGKTVSVENYAFLLCSRKYSSGLSDADFMSVISQFCKLQITAMQNNSCL